MTDDCVSNPSKRKIIEKVLSYTSVQKSIILCHTLL